MYLRPLLIFLPFLFIHCSDSSQSHEQEPSELEERIDRIENGLQPDLQIAGDSVPTYNIEARMQALGIPGVSIAFLKDGEIEWAKGYGYADVAEEREMTIETMLLAGSVSKPIAAVRPLQLAEQGAIHLDSNVNKYLSSWQLPDNEFTASQKVTTRRILNHTAGLTVWGFPGYLKGDAIPSTMDVLDGKGNTEAVRVFKEPGESWMYSGGGYTIMQLMMSDLEGRSYPELMQEHVLDPLGMTKSTFVNPLPEDFHDLAATGYRRNGLEVQGKWPIYPEMAAAGLWTTPSQLILWAKEIQEIYQNQNDGILKAETVNDMLDFGMKGHGLGPYGDEHLFEHGGADEGFRAKMVAWLNEPYAVVIMVNSDNGSIMQEIMLSLAAEYDLPGIEPSMRTPIIMTEAERTPYLGTYYFTDYGNATFSIHQDGLMAIAEFTNEPLVLRPESDTSFFDVSNGERILFHFEDGIVTGLSVNDFFAAKVE